LNSRDYRVSNGYISASISPHPRSPPPLIVRKIAAGVVSSEDTPDFIVDGRRENFVPLAGKTGYSHGIATPPRETTAGSNAPRLPLGPVKFNLYAAASRTRILPRSCPYRINRFRIRPIIYQSRVCTLRNRKRRMRLLHTGYRKTGGRHVYPHSQKLPPRIHNPGPRVPGL
jgi:hypothetical protein